MEANTELTETKRNMGWIEKAAYGVLIVTVIGAATASQLFNNPKFNAWLEKRSQKNWQLRKVAYLGIK